MKPAPHFLVAAVVALLATTPVRAANFYINASGPTGNGSGSSADNAADASTVEKFHTVNQTHNLPGTVIVYAPGTYQLGPAFSMFNGVTHQGAGIDSTIIKLADGSASGTFTPMWLAEKGTISNFKFADATIDLNATHAAWWTQGKGNSMAFAFTTADHCTIQRVKFINMGGRKMESFPVFFVAGHSTPGVVNHNLIDACIFTQPVPKGNNDGGLTCIMMADAQPKITVDNTNVVSNCQFLNLKNPEYSDLPYAQCCTCPVVTNNKAAGVDSLWFIEPGSQVIGNNSFFNGQTIQITGNTLTDSGLVAMVLMHHNGTLAADLNVQNNTLGMTQHPYLHSGPRGPMGVSVEHYENGNPSVGNITVQGNTFIAPLPMATPPIAVSANPTDGSGKYFHVASLSVLNNKFVNFPKDGKELTVSKNPAYVPKFTNTGNAFVTGK